MLPLSYHVLSVLHGKATFATSSFFSATPQLDDGIYHTLRWRFAYSVDISASGLLSFGPCEGPGNILQREQLNSEREEVEDVQGQA